MDEPLCTLATVQPGAATGPSIVPTFPPTSRPLVLDETAGAFLGCIVSNGYINDITHTIALIASDKEQVDQFAVLVHTLFGLPVTRRFDANCWRASVMSPEAVAWLLALGLKSMTTHDQQLPDSLLRSPKSVVMAFLQALYDGAGTVEPTGVTLTTPSEVVGQIVQLLLLNVGILSTRREQANGYWHIALTSHSVSRFAAEIGFRLARPQRALQHWLATHPWPQPEDWQDDIVELTCRRAAVYDISVTETHRYAAQGFINHNSYWHSEIMTRKMVQDSEIISFADLHSGVVATGSGRLNPYKLGIELLRHIEERWDKGRFGKAYDECDDLYEK
ncbi:MAG: SpoVR family protein, partial [Chloroflexaceae bacterium]|nr:SpoVR family protein [Chloroflexaceae bacterium]